MLFLFAATAAGQTPQQPQQESDQERRFREMISRRVVLRIGGEEKVELRNDVVYKKVGQTRLLADFYLPRPRPRDAVFPAVILIHGGVGEVPVKPKDWGAYVSWGELIAASGMVGIPFNHRLGFPEPHFDEAFSDLADLIAFVRENAEYFHVDKDRICLAAYSAGGPLLSAAMRERRPYIRCLVSYYNFLDLQKHPRVFEYASMEKLKEISPITYVERDNPNIPPMLIARAGRDEIPDLNDSIDRFIQAAIAHNAAVTIANHPTAPHGFDTRTPDARTREILKQTLDFLKWHLGLNRPAAKR